MDLTNGSMTEHSVFDSSDQEHPHAVTLIESKEFALLKDLLRIKSLFVFYDPSLVQQSCFTWLEAGVFRCTKSSFYGKVANGKLHYFSPSTRGIMKRQSHLNTDYEILLWIKQTTSPFKGNWLNETLTTFSFIYSLDINCWDVRQLHRQLNNTHIKLKMFRWKTARSWQAPFLFTLTGVRYVLQHST